MKEQEKQIGKDQGVEKVNKCRQEVGKKLKRILYFAAKNLEFPSHFPEIDRTFGKNDFKGIIVTSVRAAEDVYSFEHIVFTPKGLFRAPWKESLYVGGSDFVPDINNLKEASPEDYVDFAGLALRELRKYWVLFPS